jgi:hypothetical protein
MERKTVVENDHNLIAAALPGQSDAASDASGVRRREIDPESA